MMSIEPIHLVVSNENDNEKSKVVDNNTSISTMVSPSTSSHAYSFNDSPPQNNNSDQKGQNLEIHVDDNPTTNNNHMIVTPGGIELDETKDTQSNNKNTISSDFVDPELFYLTKSTSRSFDSYCNY